MRSPPSLPATVVRALAAVRRRRRTLALIEATAWTAGGFAVVGLGLPLVGLPEEGPGAWARALARLWIAACVLLPIVRFVVPPWLRTADPLRVARAVDDRVPQTRDSLHAAVDLAGALDAGKWDDPVTRHLVRDHLAAASDRVSVVDPRSLLPWSSLGRRTLGGPALLIVAATVLLVSPEPADRGWDRLFGPPPATADAGADDAAGEDLEPVTLVLRNLVLKLAPPAYAARETLTLDGTTGDFQALPGTTVELAADVPSGGESVAVVWLAPEGEPVRFDGSVRGDRVKIEFVAPGSGRYWVELGRGRLREELRTRRFRVEALPDDPPELEVSGPGGAVEIKPDDVLPLEFQDDTAPGGKASGGTVQASPYVPRIKLWEESLHAFGGDAEQYDRILSRFAKRRVEAASWGAVARDPLPLAVIYVLTPHREAARPIEINAIDEFEATMCLAASMYQAETYTDERAAFALDAAAKLPAAVPVRQVSYARSYDGLDELRAAILSDAGSLTR